MKHLMLAAAILCAPLSAGAATIFSDDFESPNNSQNWQVYQTFGDWESTSGTGIEIQTNGTVGGVSARSGDQYVELDSDTSRGGVAGTTNSSMTTFLNLVGGTYLVEWYYQPRTNTPGSNNIGVYLVGDSATTLFDNLLGSVNSTSVLTPDWVKVSYTFTVTGLDNLYALTFRAEGTSDSLGGYIDDVSVAAVPVPAAGFLLLGALGGLAALRRRKTAA
jgi:hypothetical protein